MQEKLVGVRDRFLLDSFHLSLILTYLYIFLSFIPSDRFVRDLLQKSSAKRVRNKPRSICACYVSLIQFCTAASLSLLSLITFSDLYIYFFLFCLFYFFRVLPLSSLRSSSYLHG